jgi:hypothetical protein
MLPPSIEISVSFFGPHQNNAAIEHDNGVTQIIKRKYRLYSYLFVGAIPDICPSLSDKSMVAMKYTVEDCAAQ